MTVPLPWDVPLSRRVVVSGLNPLPWDVPLSRRVVVSGLKLKLLLLLSKRSERK